jgi:hypothetical protein
LSDTTFPDDGQTDILAAFETLIETGFDGYLRSDHTPHLAISGGRRMRAMALRGISSQSAICAGWRRPPAAAPGPT